jgi:hypothetical protein
MTHLAMLDVDDEATARSDSIRRQLYLRHVVETRTRWVVLAGPLQPAQEDLRRARVCDRLLAQTTLDLRITRRLTGTARCTGGRSTRRGTPSRAGVSHLRHVAERIAVIPRCEECREFWLPNDGERWLAYWIDNGPEERLLFYCRSCAEREFDETTPPDPAFGGSRRDVVNRVPVIEVRLEDVLVHGVALLRADLAGELFGQPI